MAHEWHRGVLTASSWHGLEDIGVMTTAEDQIALGESSGAWPVALDLMPLHTSTGLRAPVQALVGHYQGHPSAVLGAVGDRYRATTPAEWRDLCRAAVVAGAAPTGAFALRDGSRVLATFDVGGDGIRTQLILADSFDGSMRLTAGTTSVRVVCANTLSAAMRSDGEGMAKLRHTASLETKVQVLQATIADTIKTGEKVRDLFARAEQTILPRAAAQAAFDALFPEAEESASANAKTRAENLRTEARLAAARPENRVGTRPGNLATLWNAATWLVDRHADGTRREVRGGDALDSLLFGARAERIQQIQELVEVVMADGTIERMTVDAAQDHGIDAGQIARQILRDAGLSV